MHIIIMMSHDKIVGWFDGSKSGFSTDATRRVRFEDLRAAEWVVRALEVQFPNASMRVARTEEILFTRHGEFWVCEACQALAREKKCGRCHLSEEG